MRSLLEIGAATGIPGDGSRVVVVSDLRMAYGDREAVRGIDFEVRRGEIFAFLGPDGAGKTTTVEILEGYRRRSAGAVSVLGEDPQSAGRDWRARLGVVLQESEMEPSLTVRECVRMHAGYHERARPIDETIALVGLAESADVRGRRLSGGQRRRLDVALALIGDPELIFLDEPTTAVDPAARRSAWSVISELRGLGKTVLLTTQCMEEAGALADRIAVLAAGQIVATGTPRALAARRSAASRIAFTLPVRARLSDLPEQARVGAVVDDERRVSVRSTVPMAVLGALAAWAEEHGWRLRDIEVRPPSLEDVYLELTQGTQ
jgi:ABC-2 type transport system ATP-binding protein